MTAKELEIADEIFDFVHSRMIGEDDFDYKAKPLLNFHQFKKVTSVLLLYRLHWSTEKIGNYVSLKTQGIVCSPKWIGRHITDAIQGNLEEHSKVVLAEARKKFGV